MKNNDLKWDSYGRLIIGNECLIGSHIVDLLRDSISSQKRILDSNSENFVKLLLCTHCPKAILK